MAEHRHGTDSLGLAPGRDLDRRTELERTTGTGGGTLAADDCPGLGCLL